LKIKNLLKWQNKKGEYYEESRLYFCFSISLPKFRRRGQKKSFAETLAEKVAAERVQCSKKTFYVNKEEHLGA
jgi:hypothetical protein